MNDFQHLKINDTTYDVKDSVARVGVDNLNTSLEATNTTVLGISTNVTTLANDVDYLNGKYQTLLDRVDDAEIDIRTLETRATTDEEAIRNNDERITEVDGKFAGYFPIDSNGGITINSTSNNAVNVYRKIGTNTPKYSAIITATPTSTTEGYGSLQLGNSTACEQSSSNLGAYGRISLYGLSSGQVVLRNKTTTTGYKFIDMPTDSGTMALAENCANVTDFNNLSTNFDNFKNQFKRTTNVRQNQVEIPANTETELVSINVKKGLNIVSIGVYCSANTRNNACVFALQTAQGLPNRATFLGNTFYMPLGDDKVYNISGMFYADNDLTLHLYATPTYACTMGAENINRLSLGNISIG